MTGKPIFNVLITNVAELRELLYSKKNKKKTTSVDIVKAHLDQIDKHNNKGAELNAMISIIPRDLVLSIAQNLGLERSEGRIRGPLHEVPITIKDNIMTGSEFPLPTTVGTIALKSAMAEKNAPIVDLLIHTGAIIIGKANLSEMAGWKGFGITTADAGWFVIWERRSIVPPANRVSLYGLKATVGSITTERTAPWSALTDSIGGMAGTPADLADLFGRRGLDDAAKTILDNGGVVERSVPLTSMDQLILDGEDALEQLWNQDFEPAWNKFLTGYKSENTTVHTLAELVQFNYVALPAGARITGIDKTLCDFSLDVIISPMDGRIPTIAATAGYPVATMPLGYSKTNGRAFGVCIISSAGNEAKILKATHAWHATMPSRKPPPQLVNED
ncbi:amidase signature domain-containing protein [Podospora fimiseda]|uniref:Amidase signature domain-containing protein n=1 Tax=Podospora fimiseda TaxID=252190 RepID=A0AAN6YM25_9PEZI|nr:amidase signature domain-containing protein [Podospora fimiseda]